MNRPGVNAWDVGRHQRSPRKFWLAAACFKLLVEGTILFQNTHMSNCSSLSHFGTHLGCQSGSGGPQYLPQWPTVNNLLYSWLSPCSL